MDKLDNAFILAAGKGTRLRPHTNHMPKPLVPVNGRPILDYILEKLVNEGIKQVTVNHNYLGDMIVDFCQKRQDIKITLSEENEHLETGGGVKKALHTMNNDPFYLINGDALWQNKCNNHSTLRQLAEKWDSNTMDILLLLQPKDKMKLTVGVGDYDIMPDGKAMRSKNKDGSYMFTGIRVVHPRVFDKSPEGSFSFLALMDQAQENGKLYALVHDGEWHHISTPDDLESVDRAYCQLESQKQ